MRAQLILGPAATALPASLASGSVDMAYADPPYGNEQMWTGASGAFDDRWRWDEGAAVGWEALERHSVAGAAVLAAAVLKPSERAYLGTMAGVLLAVRRALKPTGTLWLQFDDVMGAHLRILCDAIFGPSNAVGLVIWRRTSAHAGAKKFGRVKDTIAVYGRSRAARWRLWRCGEREIVHGDPALGTLCVDALLEERLTATARERVGYPTQKPIALIERLISAATLPGDLVLDPTCGSGTTIMAALGLGRAAIGVDVSPAAIACAHERLAGFRALRASAPAQLDLFGAAT